jgi:hypothetical protein
LIAYTSIDKMRFIPVWVRAMSWTTNIDEAKLSHTRRVLAAFRSFATGATAKLIDLSQWQPHTSRFGLTQALFVIASGLMLLASSRLYVRDESAGFLTWSAAFTILFSLLLIVPAMVAYRLLKLRRSNFLINVILIQQALLATAALASYLVLISQQPARTDFAVLQEGRGEGTVAHRYFCGGLELSAEMAFLNERALARSRSAMERARETLSWGPPNMRDAPRVMPIIFAQSVRMRAELREMQADMARVEQITQTIVSSDQAFRDTYPTYYLALVIFALAFVAVLIGTTLHLVRAALLGDRGKRFLPRLAAIIIVAWAFAGSFIWAVANNSEYLRYSEVEVEPLEDPTTDDPMADFRRELAELEPQVAVNAARTADQRAHVRSAILSMRAICPRINTHGVV